MLRQFCKCKCTRLFKHRDGESMFPVSESVMARKYLFVRHYLTTCKSGSFYGLGYFDFNELQPQDDEARAYQVEWMLTP